MRRLLLLSSLVGVLFAADPWTADDVIKPEQAAALVTAADPAGPLIIMVGIPSDYLGAHISGSRFAGPGSSPEGIDALRKAVAGQPRSRQIILYCGCGTWDKDPNIRPAFSALRDAGFRNVKVIMIPSDLKTDWMDKGYPTDKNVNE
jgi:rhodanese-related sulfurtransferase